MITNEYFSITPRDSPIISEAIRAKCPPAEKVFFVTAGPKFNEGVLNTTARLAIAQTRIQAPHNICDFNDGDPLTSFAHALEHLAAIDLFQRLQLATDPNRMAGQTILGENMAGIQSTIFWIREGLAPIGEIITSVNNASNRILITLG